jgi:hypothetical protein
VAFEASLADSRKVVPKFKLFGAATGAHKRVVSERQFLLVAIGNFCA